MEPTAPKPWERRPTETLRAFDALSVYLKLGAARSLVKTAQALNRPSGYVRALHDWSKKYDWMNRAIAYDEHMAKIDQDARENAIVASAEEWVGRRDQTREREFKLGNALMDEAEKLMALPVGSSRWSRATIARLALVGSRLVRLAACMTEGPDRPGAESDDISDATAEKVLEAAASAEGDDDADDDGP